MKPKLKSVIVWANPAEVNTLRKEEGVCSIGAAKWFPTDRRYRLTRLPDLKRK